MLKSKPIYLDYMSTTPVDQRVIDKMIEYMGYEGNFGNPSSSTHIYGKNAMLAVDNARSEIASAINACAESIYFTSGATEANNIALFGAARFYKAKGQHIVTMTTEHKAVLDPLMQLEREGFKVTYLLPESNGLLNLELLQKTITKETILVSIMHANNEIGSIQDIENIGKILSGKGIIFHVDAAQSLGKLMIDVQKFNIDLMSFSGHKIYGPKGVGALYIKQTAKKTPRIRLQPIIFGGGQERGYRPGTLATHQIVGFGYATQLIEAERNYEQNRLRLIRDEIWSSIKNIDGMHLNGDLNNRLAGNLNFRYDYAQGYQLLEQLSPLAVSTTSACSSSSHNPSYVLKAIGLDDEQALSSIRLSVGRYTTADDVGKICNLIKNAVNNLKHN